MNKKDNHYISLLSNIEDHNMDNFLATKSPSDESVSKELGKGAIGVGRVLTD
jgi:hypothetical protein